MLELADRLAERLAFLAVGRGPVYVRLELASQAGALPVSVPIDLFPWFGPEETE